MERRRCHDLDGVAPFSSRASHYARGRPGYSDAAIAAIVQHLGPRSVILDVGSGTGLGTALLGGHLRRVVGLEPNLEMLRETSSRAGTAFAQARAEALPFGTASVDLVTAFGAFHWFQPEAFLTEARRVLRPQGRLAVIWNDWDESDAFTAAFVALMRSVAREHPPEDREAEVAPLYRSPHFAGVQAREFPLAHRLDRKGLLARMRSVSYVPHEGPAWDALAAATDALFERHADASGSVTHHYVTRLFQAHRR